MVEVAPKKDTNEKMVGDQNKGNTGGTKKKKKTKLKKFSKWLKEGAKQANTILDEVAAGNSTNQSQQPNTTTNASDSKSSKSSGKNSFIDNLSQLAESLGRLDQSSTNASTTTTSSTSSSKQSFVDKLGLAVENISQGLEQVQKYDYETESFEDAKTKVKTYKVTVRDKETGDLVSKSTQVLQPDGTIRVTATQKAEQGKFFGGQSQDLPPEFPTSGTIETTMTKSPDEKHALVYCRVLDGPDAGRTLQYKSTQESDGTTSHKLLRETKPNSIHKTVTSAVVWFVLLAVAIPIVAHGLAVSFQYNTARDAICMPAFPYTSVPSTSWSSMVFSSPTPQVQRFEAPWWVPSMAPEQYKHLVFALVCGHQDIPRTAIEYNTLKQQLEIRKLNDIDPIETFVRGEVSIQKKSGVTKATITPSEVVLVTNRGKKEVVLPAPWSGNEAKK